MTFFDSLFQAFFFVHEFFSCTLLSERLEQAMFQQLNCHLQFEIVNYKVCRIATVKKNCNNIIKERDNV